jgi:hypothetical protein
MNTMTTMQPVDASELATIEGGGLSLTVGVGSVSVPTNGGPTLTSVPVLTLTLHF